MDDREARHSSVSNEHYTPPDVIEAARKTMGCIDLDPATSVLANSVVQATNIFTKDDDGLKAQWHGNVFLNPPGGRVGRDSSIKLWWNKLCEEYKENRVSQAIFIAFSLEFLQTSQTGSVLSPWDFPICIPRKRLCFSVEKDGLLVPGTSPTHANAIIFLPLRPEQLSEGFEYNFKNIGEVGKLRKSGR